MQTETTTKIAYDKDFLAAFEAGIDPLDVAHSKIPARVLGYGEMSTVLTIEGGGTGIVYKRMPMFHDEAEVEPFLVLYDRYLEELAAAGIDVVPASITSITPEGGSTVVYIIQEKLDGRALANQAIHALPAAEVAFVFEAILERIGRVFDCNMAREDGLELGFDAQMSNWAIADFDPERGRLTEPVDLIYLDTSSPLMRVDGVHQLDGEIFLRSAPTLLRPVLRHLYLDDVLDRYYERRQIVIDVLGNLYKEKREDVIAGLIERANVFLEAAARQDFEPVTEEEVAGYYREDARIWTFYLQARRLDRALRRLLGRPYPYVLPGHIDR